MAERQEVDARYRGSDLDVGQVRVAATAVALFVAVGRAMRAVVASTFSFSANGEHQPTHREKGCGGQDDAYYDALCHINRLPIWKNTVLTTQARPMV